MSEQLQKPLVFTADGLTYEGLRDICELPAEQRKAAIGRRAPDIECVIAEQAMGWRRGGNKHSWFKGDEIQYVANNFAPLRNAVQALAAMDRMIARGWGFVPKWGSADNSGVDAYHLEHKLHVRALYWGAEPERHATALSLTVAMACLMEREMKEK